MTGEAAAEVQEIDVLILGAGINGAGLFRDLCEQGLACVIADTGDFGGGTSAAPSRLIHGGLKYLETGEFRLVAQSTLERNLLLRNAPHYVLPLATVIPVFSQLQGIGAALRTLFGSTSAPRSRGSVLVRIGLALYDAFGARQRVLPRHAFWSRARALREVPALTPRIVAAGRYHDARVTHPERLVLELVQDGCAANPSSRAMNHAALRGTAGAVLHLRDAAGADHALRPRIVVNAAGPWIDRVNAALGLPSRLIGGTRGSHVLLDHPALLRSLNGRMIYFEADDGRICLVFEHLGRALVGSTDIPVAGPDDPRCGDDEIDYLLESLRGLLPGLAFTRAQIVHAYSGIRPLPASDATTPGLVSRDHSAPVAEAEGERTWPVISLVGGKWTTFRGFAEEVSDLVLTRLSAPRRRSTRHLPIGGGHGFPAEGAARQAWIDAAAARTGCPAARCDALLSRYGTAAARVLAHEARGAAGWLEAAPDHSLAEIDWIARHERVVHLEDVVLRRTTLALTGRLSRADIARIAGVTGAALGWDPARLAREVEETAAILLDRHRTRLA